MIRNESRVCRGGFLIFVLLLGKKEVSAELIP